MRKLLERRLREVCVYIRRLTEVLSVKSESGISEIGLPQIFGTESSATFSV